MTDLNDLSPEALPAAMRGGVAEWGRWGSIEHHIRYMQPATGRRRRYCRCGCKKKSTYLGMVNGVSLADGCELSMRRWVKDPWAGLR